MKFSLGWGVHKIGPDRAGTARPATECHAILPGRGLDVAYTDRNVIAVPRKGLDGTSRQAGFIGTAVAGRRTLIDFRKIEHCLERQRTTPGMPETVIGMDQHTER